ncbi:DUF4237 domain-containing protein [Occultella glacieicola]|uniref:DUF4237 domain-containing protein n=1 Tax=Occultella glacieicola TaxID=2518684 RepID=A0ABY2E9E9_9MICO|nr:TNT domain-containing protein [Occultella glacieicola]TDE99134.1 DUF4237 domain-containing protein [Occultella glacieicola]
MAPDALSDLTEQLGRALITAATIDAGTHAWLRIDVEWSQAGTQHSGRAFLTDTGHAAPRAVRVPDDAVSALAALRTRMSTPSTGAWLSAAASVTPAGPLEVIYNYDRRPYWNATGGSMLDAPDEPPVPTDERWLADLRRHPREREHVPAWLTPDVVEGEEAARLRAALSTIGYPQRGVVLPGDDPNAALEGTIEVVRYGPRHYGVQIEDYGQHELLAEHFTERDACATVWGYLTAPMPEPLRVATAEIAQRAQAAGASYADLHRRLLQAGPGGIITNLAAGVPYDRIGVLDGLYFYPWRTPWEQRSLPPAAGGEGAQEIILMAVQPVEVQAEIVPPWFDQPGGGIRFHVEGRGRGVRDLVRAGVLRQVLPMG